MLITTIIILTCVIPFEEFMVAYIDPGSGSFILQILLGLILGSLFALKMFWRNVKYFILNIFSRSPKKPPEEKGKDEAAENLSEPAEKMPSGTE